MDADADGFAAAIPPQADRTVIEYRVKVALSDGASFEFPDNEADPWYQRYYGPVVPLYCTGFEDAAGQEGWQIFNEWAFGAPLGLGGDPDAAHEGTKVAGVDLGDGDNDGLYDAARTSRTRSPIIDVGDFTEVRLQYWRWLSVEDHEFDSAVIAINEKTAWANATRGLDPEQNDLHHIDREWRFHDLDVSKWIADGKVQVSFLVTADGGVEFGGWNVDSLCVVGVESPPAPLCGDGVVDPGEACDDGNNVGGDGCDPTCAVEPTGDTDTDGAGSGGTGDGSASGSASGTGGDSESGATTGSLDDTGGCGCATAAPGRGALGALFFAGLVVFAGRRRRVGA
ncbi:MAG: hypothetical protein H6710_23125 [Myxococcales bacterium]|nr:hypothetical protein [Myxococcales bacterium]MCB9700975.1 hypothetical protein [Myxococcales bacterium]